MNVELNIVYRRWSRETVKRQMSSYQRASEVGNDIAAARHSDRFLMVADGIACGLLLLLSADGSCSDARHGWLTLGTLCSGSAGRCCPCRLPEDSVAQLASPTQPNYDRKRTAGSDSYPRTRCRHTQALQMTMGMRDHQCDAADADDWNDALLPSAIWLITLICIPIANDNQHSHF